MNKHPLRDITEQEIRTFEENGVLHMQGVLDDEWVARMQEAVDDILDHPTEYGHDLSEAHENGRYAFDNNMWMFHPEFRAFVHESPMAETAARLLRSRAVNLIFDFLLVKEPHTPTPTTWHQDMPGNPVEGNACGMWVSLDHVTAGSGAVQWARGSHKWGKRYDPVGDGRGKQEGYGYVGDAPVLEQMPDIAGNPDAYDIVSFENVPRRLHRFQPADVPRRTRQRQRPAAARPWRAFRRRGLDLRGSHRCLVQSRPGPGPGHRRRRAVSHRVRPPCLSEARARLGCGPTGDVIAPHPPRLPRLTRGSRCEVKAVPTSPVWTPNRRW